MFNQPELDSGSQDAFKAISGSQDASKAISGSQDAFKHNSESQDTFKANSGSQVAFKHNSESQDTFKANSGSQDAFKHNSEGQDKFKANSGSQDAYRANSGSQDTFKANRGNQEAFKANSGSTEGASKANLGSQDAFKANSDSQDALERLQHQHLGSLEGEQNSFTSDHDTPDHIPNSDSNDATKTVDAFVPDQPNLNVASSDLSSTNGSKKQVEPINEDQVTKVPDPGTGRDSGIDKQNALSNFLSLLSSKSKLLGKESIMLFRLDC